MGRGCGQRGQSLCGGRRQQHHPQSDARGRVTTLAGSTQFDLTGTQLYGSADGTGSAAQFWSPEGVAVDSAGNVYVGDDNNFTVRKVTPAGVVTTIAGSIWYGSTDGTGSAARFNVPHGMAVDGTGNLYVADWANNTVRKMTSAGRVTTLAGLAGDAGYADGAGNAARFAHPVGVAVDSVGNLYVTDHGANTVRKVTPAGVVTTLAGSAGNAGSADGTNNAARFSGPYGVVVDGASSVYVADSGNNTIRKMTPMGTNWVVTTLAGLAGNSGSTDGTGTNALFNSPRGMAVDSAGNVYVADFNNSTIRKITLAGVVTTLAGSAGNAGYADATGTNALLNGPTALAVDSGGNVYVTEYDNSTARKVTPEGVVTTLAGNWGAPEDGTETNAWFSSPFGVAVDSALSVYVVDTWNYAIRKGVPARSVPPPVLEQPSLHAGQFGFDITGLANLAVDLESSDDLLHWQFVDTYVLEGGTNNFVSPNPPQGLQLYRAHVR